MRILVIGGCHTYGYGLRPGQSFVDQFARRLHQEGQPTLVDYYTPVDLNTALPLLRELDLASYDRILLQLGNYRLQHPPFYKQLWFNSAAGPKKPAKVPVRKTLDDLAALRKQVIIPATEEGQSLLTHLKVVVKLFSLRAMRPLGQVGRLSEVTTLLDTLLRELRPHRQKVILLTPFPHRDPVSNWLRRKGRALFMKLGAEQGVRVIDSHRFIPADHHYFIPGDPGHLNAISHELLGWDIYRNCQEEGQPIEGVETVR